MGSGVWWCGHKVKPELFSVSGFKSPHGRASMEASLSTALIHQAVEGSRTLHISAPNLCLLESNYACTPFSPLPGSRHTEKTPEKD